MVGLRKTQQVIEDATETARDSINVALVVSAVAVALAAAAVIIAVAKAGK